MATKENSGNNEKTPQTPQMKMVRNRNSYKVELVVDGRLVVLPPGRAAKVPVNFNVPANLGVYVIGSVR